jgi:origin recognition complex subunit 2
MKLLERFNFIWHDLTTFAPYTFERSAVVPIVGGGEESRARGIQYVLRSLTPNHRDILMVLAEQIVNHNQEQGLAFFSIVHE